MVDVELDEEDVMPTDDAVLRRGRCGHHGWSGGGVARWPWKIVGQWRSHC